MIKNIRKNLECCSDQKVHLNNKKNGERGIEAIISAFEDDPRIPEAEKMSDDGLRSCLYVLNMPE